MENHLTESAKRQVKHWWISLIVGILAVAIGLLSAAEPLLTIGVLTIFFIANFFVSGIFEIYFALMNRKFLDRWGWMLAGGIVNLAFASILLAFPITNMLIFIYYVSFYILLQALLGLWGAITLKALNIRGWKSHIFMAILGVLLAIFLIIKPVFAGTFITIIFAITIICYGLFRISYALKLRKMKKFVD